MKSTKFVFHVLSLLAVTSLLAACGAKPTVAPTAAPTDAATMAPTDAPVDPMMALVDACKAEGMLSIIATPRSWANYGEIMDIFTTMTGVELNSLDENAGSATELEAIKANKDNKGPQAPDIIDVGYGYGPQIIEEALVQPYKVSTWDNLPDTVLGLPSKDPEGYWTAGYYGTMTFEVNTAVVTNVPQTWADLLKPEYAGQVALSGDPRSSNQAAQSVIAAALANGGSFDNIQPGLDFFKQLNDLGNFVPVIAKPGTIAQGATPIVLAWDYLAFGDKDTFAGNPTIEVVYPSPSIASMYIQAISAYAPHPNCAKVWMEILHSDEGQLAWMKGHAYAVHFEEMNARGVVSADIVAGLPPKTVTASTPSLAQLTAARDAIKTGWDTTVGVDIPASP